MSVMDVIMMDPAGFALCAVSFLLAVAAIVCGMIALVFREEEEETWLM